MKKQEVESILLVDKYLICRIFEKNSNHISLTRRYMAHKINKVLQKRSQSRFASLFGILGF